MRVRVERGTNDSPDSEISGTRRVSHRRNYCVNGSFNSFLYSSLWVGLVNLQFRSRGTKVLVRIPCIYVRMVKVSFKITCRIVHFIQVVGEPILLVTRDDYTFKEGTSREQSSSYFTGS